MSQRDRGPRLRVLGASLALTALTALTALAWAPPQDDDALLPEQILARMHRVYAECESYADTGRVRTVFHSERGERVVVKPFAAAFRRPDRFRFEYLEARDFLGSVSWTHYVIWRGGDEVRTRWDARPGVHDETSLERSLVAAAGVSSGASLKVPEMLLPDLMTSSSFVALKLLRRLPDASIDEVECFRLKGSLQHSPVTLWIAKESLLLRRIESESQFDDFRTVAAIDYDPMLDVELSDEELAFDASPFPR